MKNKFLSQLQNQVENSVWTGYVTYYPHKSAYRELKKINLKSIWQGVNELNLYVHTPFCNRKCAYCNLFSMAMTEKNKQEIYSQYVKKVIEEIKYTCQFIDKNAQIYSLYFGGGTPTVLSTEQLKQIIDTFKNYFVNWKEDIEICTECSPDTLSEEYIKSLKDIGFKRISVGVQSFKQQELDFINRKIDVRQIDNIILWCKKYNMGVNLDLIYGLPNQTENTILENVQKAISLSPDNICMYPLAIRPKTAISNMDKNTMFTTAQKYKIYAKIRKLLELNNYECQTIVRFVKKSTNITYQQQRYEYLGISTLGVGAGARSYTENASYCLKYKVQSGLVKNIITEYLTTEAKSLKFIGFIYDTEELKRKYIMLNILDPGIDMDNYKKHFNSNLLDDFKLQFNALNKLKMIKIKGKMITLTKLGRQYCDICANIFVSENVKKLYKTYKAE